MGIDNKKIDTKKWGNIIFIVIVAIVLFFGLVRTVVFPNDINYYENRYSNKIIAPNQSSILDASFQNSVEDALSDQIPGAQRLKKFYNEMHSLFSNFLVTPVIENNTTNYINYKNGTRFFGGYYVYAPYTLERVSEQFKAKAENYNTVFEAYPEIDFYVYYIEKDTDINFESGEKINADDYLFSLLDLDDSRKRSFEINSFQEFSDYFYKTDHHWNYKGSYFAYLDVVNLLQADGTPIEKGKEVLIANEFMGSKAAASGSNIVTEPFYVYEFDFPTFQSIERETKGNYGNQEDYISSSPVESISYSGFYGGDDGEIIFDTGNTDRENVLIIGESYDNAILKLLATHFNKTHSIDLRNYEHFNGSPFDFRKYVEANDIDKVLFIGNSDFYYLNTFALEN